MLIFRKAWTPAYKKVAAGFKIGSRFWVIIASNDGVVVRTNMGRRRVR